MDLILKKLKKAAGNEYSFTLDDKDNPYMVEEWIDTGCYALNAILSDGDIYKGMPKGKRIIFAGPSSTAKSYFIVYMIKAFLESESNPYVIVFESEGATITNMAADFGIPEDRLIIMPVMTVESFRTQVTKLLDEIVEMRGDKENTDPPNFLIALDSLGMLGTEKEYRDSVSGSDKTDMTRAKIIRSIFRLITLKLSLSQTTLIVANHVGAAIGCLVKNSSIRTSNGLKNIQDFKIGDSILTKEGVSQVSNIFEYDNAECYEVEFEDGSKIKCTEEHKFLIDGTWIPAKYLKVNDDAQEL